MHLYSNKNKPLFVAKLLATKFHQPVGYQLK